MRPRAVCQRDHGGAWSPLSLMMPLFLSFVLVCAATFGSPAFPCDPQGELSGVQLWEVRAARHHRRLLHVRRRLQDGCAARCTCGLRSACYWCLLGQCGRAEGSGEVVRRCMRYHLVFCPPYNRIRCFCLIFACCCLRAFFFKRRRGRRRRDVVQRLPPRQGLPRPNRRVHQLQARHLRRCEGGLTLDS